MSSQDDVSYPLGKLFFKKNLSGTLPDLEFIKLFSLLNSAEHGINPAHKS